MPGWITQAQPWPEAWSMPECGPAMSSRCGWHVPTGSSCHSCYTESRGDVFPTRNQSARGTAGSVARPVWQPFCHIDPDLSALPKGDFALLRDLASSDAVLPAIDPMRPAAMFHTSGTTGTPKLMAIGQAGIIRMGVSARIRGYRPASRLAMMANPAFDALNFELWGGALLNGATLVPFSPEQVLNLDALAQRLREQAVTGAFFTTSLFHLMVDLQPDALLALDWAVLGGERASAAHIHRLFASAPDTTTYMVNGYARPNARPLRSRIA
jgi:non-ribosomal peptide synthetase component F